MRTCKACGLEKRESEFRYHASIKTRINTCLKCERENSRQWRVHNKDKKKMDNARYYQEHKAEHAERCRRYNDTHPNRTATLAAYELAVQEGRITPSYTCEVSGETDFVEAHFLSYVPGEFDLMYLSRRVHKRLHAAMNRTRTGRDQTRFPDVHNGQADANMVTAYIIEQHIV